MKKLLWFEIKCISLKASRSLQYFLKILEIKSNLKGNIGDVHNSTIKKDNQTKTLKHLILTNKKKRKVRIKKKIKSFVIEEKENHIAAENFK